jgi:hypothetical protein
MLARMTDFAKVEDFVAETWAQRAQAELGAEKRFLHLAQNLRDLGAHEKIVSLALQSARDEAWHSKICADLAKHFGHETGFSQLSHQSHPEVDKVKADLSSGQRLVYDVVAMCCLTETVNAALLSVLYESTEISVVKKVTHRILTDEIKHSQMGWAFLESEENKRDFSFLAQYIPVMLTEAVQEELFIPPVSATFGDSSLQYGVLPLEKRLAQFQATMEGIVLPGLETYGIDINPAKSWLLAKSARTSLRHSSAKIVRDF